MIADTYTLFAPYLLPTEIYAHITYISCNFDYLLIGVTKPERSAASHTHVCLACKGEAVVEASVVPRAAYAVGRYVQSTTFNVRFFSL